MQKSLVAIAIALSVTAGAAHAERAIGISHRQNLTIDRTHVNAAGGVSTRHMQQNVTADGFTRDLSKTRPNGDTATRRTEVVNDTAAGVRTRAVEGTTFAGKAYSGQSVTARTENGYTRDGVFTGPNGGTSTRSVDATVDRDAGTLTKNTSVTGPNGQTSSTTVVRQRGAMAE